MLAAPIVSADRSGCRGASQAFFDELSQFSATSNNRGLTVAAALSGQHYERNNGNDCEVEYGQERFAHSKLVP
jgi:hypothetical protein